MLDRSIGRWPASAFGSSPSVRPCVPGGAEPMSVRNDGGGRIRPFVADGPHERAWAYAIHSVHTNMRCAPTNLQAAVDADVTRGGVSRGRRALPDCLCLPRERQGDNAAG
jgi:hypothetical protein